MSVEERMLERFTRERQRTSRASVFNLEDDIELTHYGQSLSNLDDFDSIPLESEEESEGGESSKGQLGAQDSAQFSYRHLNKLNKKIVPFLK